MGNGGEAPPGTESVRGPERSDGLDAAAEEDLVHSFRERIFVMALVRTRDRSAAQDLAQEALLAAIVALRAGRLRDSEKLSAFVWGTARNVINNFVRARSRMPGRETLAEGVGAEGSQLTDLETAERLSLVTRALARLEPAERAILQMTLVEGLQPDEIARRLGLTSEAMRQRKSRALRKVTKVVENLSRS